MKTLQEIDAGIKVLREKTQIHQKKLSLLISERRLFIKDNGLLITDLSSYQNKHLSDITAIDSEGNVVYLPDDEGIYVTSESRLSMSSFSNGILEWDNNKQKYILQYHYRRMELDIVGFIDIIEEY